MIKLVYVDILRVLVLMCCVMCLVGGYVFAFPRKVKDPIDEIFVSSTIHVESCGYLEHTEMAGDHMI